MGYGIEPGIEHGTVVPERGVTSLAVQVLGTRDVRRDKVDIDNVIVAVALALGDDKAAGSCLALAVKVSARQARQRDLDIDLAQVAPLRLALLDQRDK